MRGRKLVLFALRCVLQSERVVWTERLLLFGRSDELGIESFPKIDSPFLETE